MDLSFWKADHRDAYKQLPIRQDHAGYCVVVLKGPDGVAYGFRPKTLLFGSNVAVVEYNAVSRFVSVLYTKVFGLPCISFFDDFAGVAHKELGSLPLECFEELNEALGLMVKKEKSVQGDVITFLGLKVSCVPSGVRIELPNDKREAYREQILAILEKGSCSQGDADSLFGRLQFCESAVFGRANRVFMVPIYLQKAAEHSSIPYRLRAALVWFAKFLERPKVRLYKRPSPTVHAVLFSDASLEAVGAAIYLPGKAPLVYASLVPNWFWGKLNEGDNAIFVLEAFAALFAVQRLAGLGLMKPMNTYVFMDNNASLSVLIKAASKCDLAGAAAFNFWAETEKAGLVPWLERVPTELNPADAPSRGEGEFTLAPFPSPELPHDLSMMLGLH